MSGFKSRQRDRMRELVDMRGKRVVSVGEAMTRRAEPRPDHFTARGPDGRPRYVNRETEMAMMPHFQLACRGWVFIPGIYPTYDGRKVPIVGVLTEAKLRRAQAAEDYVSYAIIGLKDLVELADFDDAVFRVLQGPNGEPGQNRLAQFLVSCLSVSRVDPTPQNQFRLFTTLQAAADTLKKTMDEVQREAMSDPNLVVLDPMAAAGARAEWSFQDGPQNVPMTDAAEWTRHMEG